MLNSDPTTNVWIDDRLLPAAVYTAPPLTPAEWLAMLPGVVAQLEPEKHEDFVAEILRACDQAGVELAGCMADEFVVAKNWM